MTHTRWCSVRPIDLHRLGSTIVAVPRPSYFEIGVRLGVTTGGCMRESLLLLGTDCQRSLLPQTRVRLRHPTIMVRSKYSRRGLPDSVPDQRLLGGTTVESRSCPREGGNMEPLRRLITIAKSFTRNRLRTGVELVPA